MSGEEQHVLSLSNLLLFLSLSLSLSLALSPSRPLSLSLSLSRRSTAMEEASTQTASLPPDTLSDISKCYRGEFSTRSNKEGMTGSLVHPPAPTCSRPPNPSPSIPSALCSPVIIAPGWPVAQMPVLMVDTAAEPESVRVGAEVDGVGGGGEGEKGESGEKGE